MKARNNGRVNPSEIKGSVTLSTILDIISWIIVSILQKSRVQLHPGTGARSRPRLLSVNPSEIKGSVTRFPTEGMKCLNRVSILQKSRVQLHM